MKKTILIFFFAFTFICNGILFSQDKLATRADSQYEEYSFSPAIDIYKKVLDKGYVSADLLKNLGNSYYFNSDYTKASDIYQRLVKNYGEEVGPEYYFRYAQTLKSIGDYEGSNDIMNKFSELTGEDMRAKGFQKEKDYLEEIKRNSGRYTIKPFKYNTSYSEFAPTFYKEGLIFSSDRDTGNFARYRHSWNSKDFLDIYKVNTDSIYEESVSKLGDGVNTRLHESTSATTKDGKTLYFTRNNTVDGKYKKDEKGVIRLKIYRAIFADSIKEWGNIIELPFNSDSFSVAHPTLSSDEKTLYFSSDMPGSIGSSDIFKVSINENGTFGEPMNLGNSINTESRETFPFVTSEDILYFSSDGHPGLGGLDIFATKLKDVNLNGLIVNIGESINSTMDDFTFIFNEKTREGYFASNREEGKGADDIYSFIENEPLLIGCNQRITGTVRDKITNEVLVGSSIKIIDKYNQEVISAISDSQGSYSVELNCNQVNFVRALMEGYVPSEEYLSISEGKAKIIDFYLERDKVSAGFGDDLAKLFHISAIYFDYNEYKIIKTSEIELEKVIAGMEKYPSLKIKINSYTDSRGKDSYNLLLSQKRAESTVNYMISKGISKDRVSSEGYGETKLVNHCKNGVKCTNDEHELNRRSEFIILQ